MGIFVAAVLFSLALPALAGGRCETVAWPVYGEALTADRVFRATGGGLEVTERLSGERRLLTPCDGLPGSHVLAVAPFGDGAVLAVRGGGLWLWDARGGVAPVMADEPLLRWVTAVTVYDGAIVAGTVGDGVVRISQDGGRWLLDRPWAKWRTGRVSALAVAGGALWVGRDQKGLWRLDAKGREARTVTGSVQGLRVLPDGRLLVDRGVEVCAASGRACRGVSEAPAWAEAPPAGELPSNHLTALAVWAPPGGEPALWAGTFDQGVVVRRGERWERPDAEGEAPRFVNQLVAAGDALWVATPTGAYRLRDGRWTRFGETAGLLTDRVNGVHVDGAGRVWFATSEGLSVWGERGFATVTKEMGLPHRIVHAIVVEGDTVWAGTSDGLVALSAAAVEQRDALGEVRVLRAEGGTLSGNWVTALAAEGGVIVGTYDRGVDRIGERGGAPLEGLGPVWVNPHGIWRDPATGATYVATLGDGLWRSTPRGAAGLWERVAAPLPSDDVTAIARLDGLWIATRGGLLHLPE